LFNAIFVNVGQMLELSMEYISNLHINGWY